ncbi:MAG: cell wall hydrolase [Oscillospiraceae bacterium]
MRRKLLLPVAALLLLLTVTAKAADSTPRVYVDGMDADPAGMSFIMDGTVYVPLRSVGETLGATVVIWDPNTRTAEIEAEGLYIAAVCGEKYITANGRYLYVPETVIVRDGRLMVPVRTLAAAFGTEVRWSGENNSVYITGGGEPIAPGDEFYDETDVYWLSRLIYAEACGESLEGKIAVGNVVLNRVENSGFPDTVKEVIFDRRYGIQFSPAYSGAIYNEPTRDCIAAAKLALEGVTAVEDCLYFSASYAAQSCWAGRNRELVVQIDNQVFFA